MNNKRKMKKKRSSRPPAKWQLARNPRAHWKRTNALTVRKRDTGKMNALREKGGTKKFSNWSDGARAPCHPFPTQSPWLPFNWGTNKSNSYMILVQHIQLLKDQRAFIQRKSIYPRGHRN
jgi:hypothetical protein